MPPSARDIVGLAGRAAWKLLQVVKCGTGGILRLDALFPIDLQGVQHRLIADREEHGIRASAGLVEVGCPGGNTEDIVLAPGKRLASDDALPASFGNEVNRAAGVAMRLRLLSG